MLQRIHSTIAAMTIEWRRILCGASDCHMDWIRLLLECSD